MVRFAGPGDVYLYSAEDPPKERKQVIWGDWLNVQGPAVDGWFTLRWGGELFRVREEDTQEERPLDVIFLDVGQGDSCILTTPETGDAERVMVIDAGIGDNAYGYLVHRFGKLKADFHFHAAVVTHPDADHYRGFQEIFEQPRFHFEHVYHNGIAERAKDGDAQSGKPERLGRHNDDYLLELAETHQDMADLFADESRRGRMDYPELMHAALTGGRVGGISMLSTGHGTETPDGRRWMPGFSPDDAPQDLTIEVLGPVVEPKGGKARLRWFGPTPDSKAKSLSHTKNGHSVLLRLKYRDFTLLFGGDLNKSSETFLLRHYGFEGKTPDNLAEINAMIREARRRFHADMMKSCHHGSNDVTDEFLQAADAFAYVVSSGDNESHAHPRPDLLGRLGKHGRGEHPLILCTELLRSTNDRVDLELRDELERNGEKLDRLDGDDPADLEEIVELRLEREEIHNRIFASQVGVYGAITLRTDGRKALITFRLEKPRGKKRWQCYWYELDPKYGFMPMEDGGH